MHRNLVAPSDSHKTDQNCAFTKVFKDYFFSDLVLLQPMLTIPNTASLIQKADDRRLKVLKFWNHSTKELGVFTGLVLGKE